MELWSITHYHSSMEKRFKLILCTIICVLWLTACHFNLLSGAVLGSALGALAGPIGMIGGCILGIISQYCADRQYHLLSDLVCLPLVLLFLFGIGQYKKFRKTFKASNKENDPAA
jgi:hypothetical protein